MSQTTLSWLKSSLAVRTSAVGVPFLRPGAESSSTLRCDRGTMPRQLGIFHEPQTLWGQISTLATHPVTIARAFARKLLRK
jgi:hypothetical protein